MLKEKNRLIFCIVLIVFGLFLVRINNNTIYGSSLGTRSVTLSSSEINATTDYAISLETTSVSTVGSIRIQFCSNNPISGTPCIAPNGFDDSAAVLSTQTGLTGFSINGASTANEIVLGRAPASAPVGTASYSLSGIKNPSDIGSYYVRILTYASNNATGNYSDYGGLAFSITNALSISATVPPYLTFCTGITINNFNCLNAQGDFLDLGELSVNAAKYGTSQMLVATNAELGYGISAQGTTLTSGNNVIPEISPGDISRPSTSQFGLNLRANTSPAVGSNVQGPGVAVPTPNYNQPNIFRFVSGDTLASHPSVDDVRVYTVSYIANIASSQSAGIYVSTITYICLANF